MTPTRSDVREFVAGLNAQCFCINIDVEDVWAQIGALTDGLLDASLLAEHRPYLFANGPVFVEAEDVAAMEDVVLAIEAAADLPAYQELALSWAPQIARNDPGPRGALMGYDFHLGPDGPRLIEVNTNAGGAFLNAVLAQAQIACCPEVGQHVRPQALADFETAIWEMMVSEWRLAGRDGAPRTIAIIDTAPTEQFLYPEFLLARALFERRGAEVAIADPADLTFEGDQLRHGKTPIDLVYNRLVDFDLSEASSSALCNAWRAGAVVLTPGPRNHALLADKRNLTLLSDPECMAAVGLDPKRVAHLAAIPRTELVTPENAERLWTDRRRLFFKPAGGHAGKAVYRGDKITKSAWSTVIGAGGYVAQDFAPPSERTVRLLDGPEPRRMDMRLYTYAGRRLLVAARLYSGQTTNFRTPGGGFAPVIVV